MQASNRSIVAIGSLSTLASVTDRLLTMPAGNDLENRMGKKAYFDSTGVF
jgi:hypothetical protein